jgi:hypothetical protein
MTALKSAGTLVACAVVSALVFVGSARATAFHVLVDTSGLTGDAVMAFDFANADSAASHRLDIYEFTTDGSLFLSATSDPANCPAPVFPFSVDACKDPADTDVTGTLGSGAGIVSISDAGSSGLATISYYQRITLGSSIGFKFEMAGDATSPDSTTPDGFAFWLLNPGDPQNSDLNPGGDLLGPGPLILYTFGGACDTSFSAAAETAPGTAACTPIEIASVPEPRSLALVGAALLGLIITRMKSRIKSV